MSSFQQKVWRTLSSFSVMLYRRSGRRIGGKAKGGLPVLLLTVAGRKSGQPHSVSVGYVLRDGSYYLAASAGGQAAEPQWIRNPRAATHAAIEVGRANMPVSVEVLRGDERDVAWRDIIVATFPFFDAYERKSGRTIAVARLTPTGAAVV